MAMISVTPIYAAILALMLVLLSVRTLLLRRRLAVSIGDGGKAVLARAVRVHGNFVEYVPLTLLLLFFLEVSLDNAVVIHVLGMLLITGRISHAYGVSRINEDFRFRVAGIALTFTAMISASLGLLMAVVA